MALLGLTCPRLVLLACACFGWLWRTHGPNEHNEPIKCKQHVCYVGSLLVHCLFKSLLLAPALMNTAHKNYLRCTLTETASRPQTGPKTYTSRYAKLVLFGQPPNECLDKRHVLHISNSLLHIRSPSQCCLKFLQNPRAASLKQQRGGASIGCRNLPGLGLYAPRSAFV